MKCNKLLPVLPLIIGCGLLAGIVFIAFAASNQPDDWLTKYQKQLEKEALDLAYQFADFRKSVQPVEIDVIEERFIESGVPILDTQDGCPSYLANSQCVYSFWEKVQSQQKADLRYLSIHKKGGIIYTALHNEGGIGTYVCVIVEWDSGNRPYVSMWETHTIQDWELTEHGNFYFRIRPANDKHYIDYCLLRLVPPDPDMCKLTNKYIRLIGYYSVNIFLCDWDEQNYGELSFNDLLEYLYVMDNHCSLQYEDYACLAGKESVLIPASVFEKTILSHFRISKDLLRIKCHYNAEKDAYPWRPFYTNDAIQYWFPFVDSEVINKRENADGTFTLTVNVSSADLKADTVFIHEVSIRPTENNGFQYVSNRIIYRTEYGIPNKNPRSYYQNTL